MRRSSLLTPLAVLVLAGCGGKSDGTAPPPAQPLASGTVAPFLTAFLVAEQTSVATPDALPALAPAGDAGVYALVQPAVPACVGVTSGGPGVSPVTYTFNSCAGPNGGVLTGQLTVAWSGSTYTLTYQNLTVTRGTQAWVLNGTKTLTVNALAHQATVTTAGLTHAFTDSANPAANASFTYACALTADWATAGQRKVWGTFSYQSGFDATLSAVIAQATPLTWATGCCTPTSGTIAFTKGLAKADVAFGLPCGTVTVTPFGQAPSTATLAACAP